jgi:hypothetical protein
MKTADLSCLEPLAKSMSKVTRADRQPAHLDAAAQQNPKVGFSPLPAGSWYGSPFLPTRRIAMSRSFNAFVLATALAVVTQPTLADKATRGRPFNKSRHDSSLSGNRGGPES